MIVYVEKKVLEDPAIVSDDRFGPVKRKFCTFREGELSRGASPMWPCLAASGVFDGSSVSALFSRLR